MSDTPFILLVDDNPKNLQVLGEMLSEINCSFGVATNGRMAIESAKSVIPDLILMDVIMPEMDGYEATVKLKENPDTKNIPIIFLTAKTDLEDIVKGFDLGGVDYVTKPFNTPELLARVKTQLKIAQDQKVIQKQKDNLNEMVHILCHDLANPLQVISMIVLSSKNNPDILKNSIEVMTDATNQSINIIELVRYLRAVEEGKTEINLSKVDVKEALELSMNIVMFRYKDKNIRLKENIPDNTFVIAEQYSLINTVFNNLISNAIKFSYEDSEIEIDCRKDNDKIILVFKDHGIGIPSELMSCLFKSGAKTTRNGTNGEVGTGFGLPLVKKIMNIYGGEINIYSREIKDNPDNHGTDIELIFDSCKE